VREHLDFGDATSRLTRKAQQGQIKRRGLTLAETMRVLWVCQELVGEWGKPGTYVKFTRGSCAPKLSLHGKVPDQGCSRAFLLRAGTRAAHCTLKPWTLGFFIYSCQFKRSHTHTHTHIILCLSCFVPFCAARLGSSSAVSWGAGRVLPDGFAQVMCTAPQPNSSPRARVASMAGPTHS